MVPENPEKGEMVKERMTIEFGSYTDDPKRFELELPSTRFRRSQTRS